MSKEPEATIEIESELAMAIGEARARDISETLGRIYQECAVPAETFDKTLTDETAKVYLEALRAEPNDALIKAAKKFNRLNCDCEKEKK